MRPSPLYDDGRLFRVQLRDLCVDLLKHASTVAGSRVFKGNPWPVSADRLPALWVSAPSDVGSSFGAGPPSFSRTATIQIIGIVRGDNPADALEQIDQFNDAIETLLMTDTRLIGNVEEVEGLHTHVELNSETKSHLAQFTLALELKYSETYPQPGQPLSALSGTFGTL